MGITSSIWWDRLKSLPLTVVLTILIWMYAEAKFTSTQDNVRMALRVIAPRADMSVQAFDPGENRDQPTISVLMTLEGPKSQIDRIYQQSLGAMAVDEDFSTLAYVPVPASLKPGDDNTFDTVTVLNSLRYFRMRGVTVTAASPARIRLEVDHVEQIQKAVEFRSTVPAERLGATPEQVTVSIPTRRLEEIGGVEHLVVLANPLRELTTLKTDQSQTVGVHYSVEYPGSHDDRITVTPAQGMLTVRVARREGITEPVGDVPVWVSGPPATLGRYNADVRPKFVKVTLVGSAPAIQKFRDRLAASVRGEGGGAGGVRGFIDLSLDDRPSDQYTRRRIRYVLPEGLSLQEGPTDADFRLIDKPMPMAVPETVPATAPATQPSSTKPS